MPVQHFYPTDVNHFEVTEGSRTRKVIEFLFPCDDPGFSYDGGKFAHPGGGRINRNWGGWGEHGEDRYMHRIWVLNKGAIYWNVDNVNRGGNGQAGDVTWTYTENALDSGSAGGHELHSDFESQGVASDTPAWIGFALLDNQYLTCELSSAGAYVGDSSEHYQWYPGNHSSVASWVNALYDNAWKANPELWHVTLFMSNNAANNATLAPIQLKNAAGARYSIPSYDAGVSAANAIANSNPTNCLDLIDGSTDPMTDVNPRFDTKYDGAGQGSHDGVVYFQMPEWEGGMWAYQEWRGSSDVASLSQDNSGDVRSVTVTFNTTGNTLIHDAFTGPEHYEVGANTASRIRFPYSVTVYYGTSSDYAAYYGLTKLRLHDGNPADASESNNDLSAAWEANGWLYVLHDSGANDSAHMKIPIRGQDSGEQYEWLPPDGDYRGIVGNGAYYSASSSSSSSEFGVALSLNYGTPYLTYSMTGLPTGLSFDPENRVIHGVLPTASASANTTVTYTARDFLDNVSSITFTLTAVGYSDANHVDAKAASDAAALLAAQQAADTLAAAAAALAAAQADQYDAEQAAAAAMIIQGSGIRRTRDLSTDLVHPDKYLDVDLLTSDDPKGIPMAVAPPIERDTEPEIARAIPAVMPRDQERPEKRRQHERRIIDGPPPGIYPIRPTGQPPVEKMREKRQHEELPEFADDYTF